MPTSKNGLTTALEATACISARAITVALRICRLKYPERSLSRCSLAASASREATICREDRLACGVTPESSPSRSGSGSTPPPRVHPRQRRVRCTIGTPSLCQSPSRIERSSIYNHPLALSRASNPARDVMVERHRMPRYRKRRTDPFLHDRRKPLPSERLYDPSVSRHHVRMWLIDNEGFRDERCGLLAASRGWSDIQTA